ncbi:hypothetical protein SAMN04487820_109190 [Actinopolyspora mzabensis]|uniref:DUF5753 domain-containing protein n=1 Tax=Actinopolyspora mzabensis TaxID=995066 RepID=A0A1G9D0S6_ACTMZ|nr:hypothetical protein SAMN04487820_109190 [Actinopolyspora mzabensis]
MRDRLIDMARDAAEPNWLAAGAKSTHKELTTLIEFERTATHILEVAPMLVPGLLQTADYARTVMAGLPTEELDMRVTTRVGRRDVLLRPGAPRFDTLIDEHVLQRLIGGHSVMGHQLRHIIAMAEQPNITVQVVPSDLNEWHLTLEGAFILFEFPKAAPIINLEHFRSSAFLYDEDDIRDYIHAADTLRQTAMSPTESLDTIARYADKMEAQ